MMVERQDYRHSNHLDATSRIANDGRKTKLPSFKSSYRDSSDGSSFVLLPPLDAEIIGKTSKNRSFYNVSPIISATNNGRRTKLPPFEPSRCDDSNVGSFVLLSPLDAKIIGETS